MGCKQECARPRAQRGGTRRTLGIRWTQTCGRCCGRRRPHSGSVVYPGVLSGTTARSVPGCGGFRTARALKPRPGRRVCGPDESPIPHAAYCRKSTADPAVTRDFRRASSASDRRSLERRSGCCSTHAPIRARSRATIPDWAIAAAMGPPQSESIRAPFFDRCFPTMTFRGVLKQTLCQCSSPIETLVIRADCARLVDIPAPIGDKKPKEREGVRRGRFCSRMR